MSIFETEYGWYTLGLEIRELRLARSYESETWERPLFLLHDEEYEAAEQSDANINWPARHVRDRRVIVGTAFTADPIYNRIFLGPPEDKTTRWEKGFAFSIYEVTDDSKPEGYVTFLGGDALEFLPNASSRILIILRAYSAFFDDIEPLLLQSQTVQMKAEVRTRGWHMLGPIGDQEIHISQEKRKREPAMLESLDVRKVFTDQPRVEDDEGEQIDPPEVVQQHMLETVNSIAKSINDVRIGVFVLIAVLILSILGVEF